MTGRVEVWVRRRLALLALLALLVGCGSRTGVSGAVGDGGRAPRETCDGTDEDGDLRVDEGLPELACGACGAAPSCVDGRPAACPAAGAEERCNAVDDDCDGRIDEGLPFEVVGAPRVLREVDEGSVGDCERCSSVTRADLFSVGERLYAVWHFDYSGYIGRASTFVQALDARGAPVGGPRPLLDVPTSRVDLSPSRDGLTALAFCERLEDSQDYLRSAFLGADARVVGERQARQPVDVRCPREVRVVWSGGRHFFASFLPGPGARLEVADGEGRSLRAVELEEPLVAPLVPWGDGVLIAQPGEVWVDRERLTPQLVLHHYDREARRVEAIRGPAFEPEFDYKGTSILPGPAGATAIAWGLVFGRVPGPEVRWKLLHVDRASGAVTLDGDMEVANAGPAPVLARRGPDDLLAAWQAGSRSSEAFQLLRFDERGEVFGAWELPERGPEDPALHVHAGRVFLIYVEPVERFQNRVELIEIGCAS